MTRRLLTSLALSGLLAAPALGAVVDGQPSAPSVAQVAPGGTLTSVVRETAIHGWPHRPTDPETEAVATLVLFSFTPAGSSGRVDCAFGATMGRSRCALRVNRRRYSVRVLVFEDGSFRLARKAVRS